MRAADQAFNARRSDWREIERQLMDFFRSDRIIHERGESYIELLNHDYNDGPLTILVSLSDLARALAKGRS